MTMDNREPNAYVKHVANAPGTDDMPPNLLHRYAENSVALVAAADRLAAAPGVAAHINPPAPTKA